MKLLTSALLAHVEAELERRELAVAEWDAKVDAAEDAARAEWERDNVSAWIEYRDTLTKLLRKGKPFTKSDLPSQPGEFSFRRGKWSMHYSGKHYTWTRGTHDHGERPIVNRRGLESLAEFLRALTDDEVSFEAIVRAGFRDGFRAAFGLPSK